MAERNRCWSQLFPKSSSTGNCFNEQLRKSWDASKNAVTYSKLPRIVCIVFQTAFNGHLQKELWYLPHFTSHSQKAKVRAISVSRQDGTLFLNKFQLPLQKSPNEHGHILRYQPLNNRPCQMKNRTNSSSFWICSQTPLQVTEL